MSFYLIEIYSWILASFIMVFIIAIGNFYQKKFNVRTFYYFYWIPVILLLIPVFQIFPIHSLISEVIEFVGSILSFLASLFLYRKMVGIK